MKKQLRVLFAAYCLIMLWLLFFQRSPYAGPMSYREYLSAFFNIRPMDTVRRFLHVLQGGYSPGLTRAALVNLLGNVVVFIPLGLFLPALWRNQRRFWLFFLTVLFAVFLVETIQLVTTLGSFDVDDLILNVVGASLGFLVWRLVLRADDP